MPAPAQSKLACQKQLFSLRPSCHYLNGAYMSPLSKKVEAAGWEGMIQKRTPDRIQPTDFFSPADNLRRLFARLIHAPDPGHIALLPAASYGFAIVAKNTPLSRGQNVVVLHEQFPSNVYTWRRLCEESGAELRTVEPPEEEEARGRIWNQRILEAIDAQTAMVALSPLHWADGTLFDLIRIGARVRDVGAALVIDGTQAIGALPFDVQRVKPDAVICAGYKWLMGPYSSGVAYLGDRYLEGTPLEENWINRRGSEDFSGLVAYESMYQEGALRFDVGERSNFIVIPMLSAGIEHVLTWEVSKIQAYCSELSINVLDELRASGYRIVADSERAAHLFGIRLPDGVALDQVKAALAHQQVSVSMRGAAVRVSPHVYNDESDLEALRDALLSCQG